MEDIELLRTKVENGFTPCFNDRCPLHGHCLRWQGRQFVSNTVLVTTVVNLSNPAIGGEQCPIYIPDKPVQMAYGFVNLLDSMPSKLAKQLMDWMKTVCNRTYAYEYRNGSRPISPSLQRMIADKCEQLGFTAPIVFDGYREEYEWER